MQSAPSGNVDGVIYKREEINLDTHPLHILKSEDKPPKFGPCPRKRTKLPSAGDIWIPYKHEDSKNSMKSADDLIIHHAKVLAREGKRVAQAPTYLEGGIVVHWLRDYSIKEEHVEPILRALQVTNGLRPDRNPSRDSKSQLHLTDSSGVTGTPMVISLLSDEEEDESATEEHIHFTRGFREDEPIVVDSDEDIITEAHPKQEASAQGLVGSVPTPRQTNHSEHLPEHHINTQDSREQGGTDVNTGSADRLVGESASQEFSPELLMRNPSSSRFSAREHPRTPPLTTSGNAGTEMRLRRRSASGQSPISSPVRNMSATHPAPRPTKDHLDNNDVDVDVDSLPAIITSTIPGKRLWTEPAHKKTITVMVSSSLSHDEEGQHDSSTQPDGLCGDLSFENDDSESESEDAKSFHSSPPPRRYVSPPRRNDLATVLLAGPSHVDFNQHVAARLGDSLESHTSPHHAKVSRTSRYRPGPEEEDMDGRQSLASSSRPDNVSGHLRQRVSSKRKSADVLVISPRTRKAARYMRTPSSDSESSEDDEDEAMASGSEADASRPWTASDQQHVQNCLQSRAGRTVCLPTTPSARARRLLIPSDDRYPLITVYMRGDLQFIHQSRLYRISHYSLPAPEFRGVADACLLNNSTAVVGYAAGYGQTQVSVVILDANQTPRRAIVSHKGHSTVNEHRSSDSSSPNAGISSLCPVDGSNLKFLSGGHDKTMRMWTLNVENGEFMGQSQRLITADHTTTVQALTYRSFDNTVFSASGPFIHTADLGQRAKGVKQERLSNHLRQIHLHAERPHVVILEVDHLDYQMEVYDTRVAGFSHSPCNRFGVRDSGKMHARSFYKGSSLENCFARGYSDGQVLIWDLKNLKNVVTRLHCKRDAAVVHTVLSSSRVMAYGHRVVTIWDRRANAV